MVIGNWVVPTLIEHGDERQQERFVPPSLRGDLVWCQLFSEPGAGSDLAGLSTRAEKVEGGWRINGQKVWTSMARDADYGILLARTDATAAKHRGLSYFLLDMSAAGLDIRPLRELTGEALFNEVFLDDVFVPDDMLVGNPGDGWKLGPDHAGQRAGLALAGLLARQRGRGAARADRRGTRARRAAPRAARQDPRPTPGRAACSRCAPRCARSPAPSPAPRPASRSCSVSRTPRRSGRPRWSGRAPPRSMAPRNAVRRPGRSSPSRNLSIAGGTTDVQLNIIGERILGLPRDAEPAPKD